MLQLVTASEGLRVGFVKLCRLQRYFQKRVERGKIGKKEGKKKDKTEKKKKKKNPEKGGMSTWLSMSFFLFPPLRV